MNGINKAIIVGTLGNDPDTRYTNDHLAITRLSVATNDQWKDKAGNVQTDTQWHRVVMFGRLAEIAGEYLSKGSRVYIEGKIKTNKWQDDNGNDRYTTEIVAREMQMLGAGHRGNFDQGSSGPQRPPQGGPVGGGPQRPAQGGPVSNGPQFDDEIPF